MMNPATLVLGIIFGLGFSGLMIFKILPPLDHSLKKQHGPYASCLFTRFGCLVIALPLYIFTIWMTLVILVDPDKGTSVLQELCNDDYSCAGSFSWGRQQFDKEACLGKDCGSENLQARSGSQPLHFPRLGLGQKLHPTEFTAVYECLEFEGDVCVQLKEEKNDKVCNCADTKTVEDFTFCSEYADCPFFHDVDDREVVTAMCTQKVAADAPCSRFQLSTDSSKKFTFQECVCADLEDCSQFSCDIFSMNYYYPNVFYAFLSTLLFVTPAMIGTYVLLKTQLRKIIKCNEADVYIYNQEAGMQEAPTAEDFANGPGGFFNEQSEKSKYRTFSKYDILGVIAGTAAVLFFSWLIVIVSGRVGLSFVALAASMIALVEGYRLYSLLRKQCKNLDDKISKNNPNPRKASL